MDFAGKSPFNGAVEDLQVNSSATMNDLNGASLNDRTVPSHSIVSIKNLSDLEVDERVYPFLDALNYICENKSGDDLVSDIFDGEFSDLIVAATSQLGGLQATSYFPNRWHVETPDDPAVHEKIKTLLHSSVDNSLLFSKNGYQPPQLYFHPEDMCFWQEILGAMTITQPSSGTVFSPGASVNISFQGSSSINHTILAMGGIGPNTQFESLPQASGSAIFQIPIEVAGVLSIAALGMADSNHYSLDSTSIFVMPQAAVDSISIGIPFLHVGVGEELAVPVTALFSDGITRHISTYPGVDYLVEDTSIAIFSRAGVLAGKQIDTSYVIVSFQGDTARSMVVVHEASPSSTPIDADESPFISDQIFSTEDPYPNPFISNVQLPIRLFQAADVTLRIFDLSGRLVKEVYDGTLHAGSHQLMWKGDNQLGLSVAAGVYVFQWTLNGEHQSVGKVIKQ